MFAFTIKNEVSNVPVIMDLTAGGYANGYVALEQGHKLYNKDYMDIDVDIHGGLTYSHEMTLEDIDELANKLVVGNVEKFKLTDKFWVIGFDTRHMSDNLETCPKSYCEQETINLYKQIKKG